MSKLTDVQIKQWIRAGERFEGRGDGGGLWLRYPKDCAMPIWRFRYRFSGRARAIDLGSYASLSLADARRTAKEMRAKVSLGHDVAGEKQTRKREAVAKIEADRNRVTFGELADEYFQRQILGRWKHPNIVRSRIERDIKPNIGSLFVEDVRPMHIDAMLQAIVKRGAPTMANDVLRWTRRMFDFAIKRQITTTNPALPFDLSDAGGKEEARTRALSRAELVKLFDVMRRARGFSIENALSFKLLLLLAVRKSELTAARVEEFDLDKAIWHLPAERTKTGAALAIPLSTQAVDALRRLIQMGGGSDYLLPARKRQERMLPHIHENTLNVALSKLRPMMKEIETFTIHDFRRTAKTQLAALGTPWFVSERCLNHKIKGTEGVYDQYEYLPERRAALGKLAELIQACEVGDIGAYVDLENPRQAESTDEEIVGEVVSRTDKVVPFKRAARG